MLPHRAGEIFRDDCVSLKGNLCRIIDLVVGCSVETEDAVADFKTGDSFACRGYFDGHVVAENEGVFQVRVDDVFADWISVSIGLMATARLRMMT